MVAGRPWQNWGRSVNAHPEFTTVASSVDDVIAAVDVARDSGRTLKPVGAGHSFTAIAATDGVQLDVSAIGGLVCAEGNLVTIGAGTHLHQLPAMLAPLGLALENMGDIDQQTIAGATSTGTHGTGAAFGGLATQNPELLPAARLGLGSLGVVVDVTLRCVPDFMVRAVEQAEPLEDVLDNWRDRVKAVDHFEFYWFAHTTSALTKSNTRLPADTPRQAQGRLAAWIDDELLPNRLFAALCELGARVPSSTPPLNRLSERLVAAREVTDRWHCVFTSPRRVRATASDDNWLSTAYGRDTGYIAVHRYVREDPTEYFAAVEAIMRGFDGRPHWGKMHNRAASDLRPAYPRFDDFLAIRDKLDPDRLFANDYLRKVLGE
ncbi:MAG: FAD-binding protein [Salinibacterium sp.]|nr:FAD-binding protein [Salinibacterium sp.]